MEENELDTYLADHGIDPESSEAEAHARDLAPGWRRPSQRGSFDPAADIAAGVARAGQALRRPAGPEAPVAAPTIPDVEIPAGFATPETPPAPEPTGPIRDRLTAEGYSGRQQAPAADVPASWLAQPAAPPSTASLAAAARQM